MRMLPGMTVSPPNFLTPRRRPAVSRPLRDEPPAFLCAIRLAPYSLSAFLAAAFFAAGASPSVSVFLAAAFFAGAFLAGAAAVSSPASAAGAALAAAFLAG